MRQILFRGKIEGTNDWVYGSYIRDKFNHMIQDDEFNTWAVDEETVGQFTGKLDKHGQTLFENDNIKIKIKRFNGNSNEERYETYKIKYDNDLCAFHPLYCYDDIEKVEE